MRQYDYMLVKGHWMDVQREVRRQQGVVDPARPGARWVCQGGPAFDVSGKVFQAMALADPSDPPLPAGVPLTPVVPELPATKSPVPEGAPKPVRVRAGGPSEKVSVERFEGGFDGEYVIVVGSLGMVGSTLKRDEAVRVAAWLRTALAEIRKERVVAGTFTSSNGGHQAAQLDRVVPGHPAPPPSAAP
jgi:hypothetical protein